LEAPDQRRNVLRPDENTNIVASLGAWILLSETNMAAVARHGIKIDRERHPAMKDWLGENTAERRGFRCHAHGRTERLDNAGNCCWWRRSRFGQVGQTKRLKLPAKGTPTGLTNSIFVPNNFSNFGSKVANLATIAVLSGHE
jgi:hypothetical protein